MYERIPLNLINQNPKGFKTERRLPFLRFDRERMQLVYWVILLKILRNLLLSKNMQWNYASFNVTLNYLMYWIMEFYVALSLALDNYEQKDCQTLGKLISQTIHTTCCCCKDDYFPKRKFKKNYWFVSLSVPCFSKKFVFYCRLVCRALSEGHMHEIMEYCVTSSFALVNWEQKYRHTLGNKPNHLHRVLWRRLFSKRKI